MQSYITLYLIEGENISLHLTGVYRDHLVIEGGQWKIRSREATMDTPGAACQPTAMLPECRLVVRAQCAGVRT